MIGILLRRNLFIVGLTFIVVAAASIWTLKIYKNAQNEGAEQFNLQQLWMARQVAMNIESFMETRVKNLEIIAVPISRLWGKNIDLEPYLRCLYTKIGGFYSILYIDNEGIIRKSYPEKTFTSGTDIKNTVDLKRPIGELLDKIRLTGESEISNIAKFRNGEAGIFILTPIFHEREYLGALIGVINLKDISKRFLDPVKSGLTGYAWMIDHDGFLLYHPLEQGLTGENFLTRDRTCDECHESFDYAVKMAAGEEGKAIYKVKGNPRKLLAYAPINLGYEKWSVGISAPYDESIGFLKRNLKEFSAVILGTIAFIIIMTVYIIFTNQKIVRREEEAKKMEVTRRLMEKLKTSEKRYRSVVENSNDGIYIIQDERFVYTNPRFQQMLGYTSEELSAEDFDIMKIIAPESRALFLERAERRKKGEYLEPRYEFTVLRKDGSKMSVELNVTPVEYKGKPAVLGIMRDISERVKVERELKQRFKELEIFVKATEDREMKMVELKKEVNSLLKELGREAKY